MSDEQHENPGDTDNPQQEMGLMLQRRALHQLERASEKPPRSPKRIALVSLMVVVMMSLFLLLIDRGVKVTHRIMDIWTPVVVDAFSNKPQSTTTTHNPAKPNAAGQSSQSEAAYMINVEPASPQNSQSSSASGH